MLQQRTHGYSSYGNQIGLATGIVQEVYHPNYVAKRMEIGAVIVPPPKENVKRFSSTQGTSSFFLVDGQVVMVLVVQQVLLRLTILVLWKSAVLKFKGNPPTERKPQRLFRRPEVTQLIKKCNDFGAGGVSVAIGELADGLEVNLDLVPKKYAGLDGTELAI